MLWRDWKKLFFVARVADFYFLQNGDMSVIILPVMKKKIYSKKSIVRFLVALGVLGALFLFFVNAPRSDGGRGVDFVVARGESVSHVATRLADAGIVESAAMFKMAVKIQGGKIQTGEYDIPKNASAWRVARMLANGNVATVSIVIPEGLTIKQIKNQLLNNSALVGAVACTAGNAAPVCNLRDGDIFPDTYHVARRTSRLAVLELARKKMVATRDGWQRSGGRVPAPLKNWNDVVTLASIVQKETPRASEMPVVASVYLNRLNKKMRLQADPTVVYALTNGLGDMQGAALLRGHLKIDSPYNTYKYSGLPPAPIANVGAAAIRAVLNPADTNYLFFVADGRGGHNFANSYEEHKKNHADWREIKKMRNKK